MPRVGLTTDVVIERGAQLLEQHPGGDLTSGKLAATLYGAWRLPTAAGRRSTPAVSDDHLGA